MLLGIPDPKQVGKKPKPNEDTYFRRAENSLENTSKLKQNAPE